MKNSTVRFVLAGLTLCLGAAVEEMLPKFAGVGFPILLSALPLVALRSPVALPVLFAVAAGAMEDALCMLPPLTSVSYYLLVIVIIRWVRLPFLSVFLSFPLYQIWLSVWASGLQGNVFTRFLLAIPMGALTMGMVAVILQFSERMAGADEVD